MIGNRIRERRLAIGLSQRQLAGTSMTRHFISLIESGRARPSEKTLRIIAQRLGKPVEYFQQGEETAVQVADFSDLILSAARERTAAKQYAAAMPMLQQVMKTGTEQPVLAEARCLLITCLHGLGRNEEAMRACDEALETLAGIKDRAILIRFYMAYGACAFALEDFPKAKQAYASAAMYSSELKGLVDAHVEALTYLGTTLLRLGAVAEAVAAYERALKASAAIGPCTWRGMIAMGLGKALYQDGRLDEARRYTQEALTLMERADSPERVLALHNLAILEAASGDYHEAYKKYQTCLAIYRDQGRHDKLASILEELAWYWLEQNDLVQAEAACSEGIQLLEEVTDGEVTGRLYRALATIYERSGDPTKAYYFMRASYELLRRIKAAKEAQLSYDGVLRVRSKHSPSTDAST